MKFSLIRLFTGNHALRNIIILGIVLRLFFVFVGGKIYYGKADYSIQGDSPAWFYSFINLAETGTYTFNPKVENGKFFRPPGYSFLFGIFYLLTFKNYLLAGKLLVWLQVLMDIFNIWLISRIASHAMKDTGDEKKKLLFSNSAALLYACYPFVIVWAPVLYAETPSLFFLLLSIFFAVKPPSPKNAWLSGLAGGIAVLMRLQCIFALIFLSLIFFSVKTGWLKKIRLAFWFGLGILMTYGWWPARNYFIHDRLVFSQDLNIGTFWSPDYMAFMEYVFAVQTDYNSVYNEIINGKPVHWPPASYKHQPDSALLDSVTSLCGRCGTGFSYFMVYEGVRASPVEPGSDCDRFIASGFTTLAANQKKYNPFNYWIKVPLGNLQKCFFKFSLYDTKNTMVKILSSALFIFRSTLIILGLFGCYLAFRNSFIRKEVILFIAGYMLSWYFFLSFFYRNMEMRYLLQADVLLLVPVAYLVLLLVAKRNQPGI